MGRPKGIGRPSFRPNPNRSISKSKPRFPTKNDYGENWATLSAYVRQRDGYRCQVNKLNPKFRCTGHYPPPFSALLHAHHIIPLPRGSNHPSNLISLCKECHGKIHGRNLGTITDKQKRATQRLRNT